MSVTVTGTKRHLDLNGSTLTTTGNVTVGGDLLLDLNDNIRFGNQLAITKENNGELKLYGGTNSTDGGFELFTWDGSAYESSFTLKNNQNAKFEGHVGIGTDPASGVELHVNGEIRVDSTSGVATRKIRSGYFSSTTDIVVASGSSASVRLQNGSTDGLVIDSSQNATFTGVLALPDGSASAPSIGNTGDTNTGMYWPGDHQLGFAVNGSRKMYMSETKTFFQNQSQGVEINNGLTVVSGGIDVTGEIQGDSLDINGASDVSGNAVFHGKTGFGGATTTYNVHAKGTGWAGTGIAIESTTTSGAVLSLFNTQRQFQIASRGNTLDFRDITDSDTVRFIVNSSGHLLPGQDSTYNLGSSGTRWSNIYADTLYGDGSNITNLPAQSAPSNMVTTDTNQSISGAKNFTSNSNQFNGHVYFNAYDSQGNHYPHFRDGSASNGANINIRHYYGSANYKTHVMSSDSSGNMQFDFQGTLKGDALTIDGGVDINGNTDISGTLTSGNIHVNSASDGILTLNQTGTDTGWSYINFNTSGTRNWYVGQDNNKNFDIYNDNTDSLGLSIDYANNSVSVGALTATTLNTGHGANELYAMNQNVRTTDAVTFNGVTSNGDIIANTHVYGRAVNNTFSHLYRFGGLFLTWDSDSYGTNLNHSITSTDNGTYSDSLTINSFDKVRINIDSNNNDSGSTFTIGKHTTGTANTLLTLEEDGDLTVTGDVIANGTVLTGAPNLSGYVTTSGNQTITGVKNFTGELHWDLSAGQYAGDPRAVVMGYSGGNYGQLGYNIDFTTTAGSHTRAFNDIPTRIDLHNGIVVYAADAGSAGTSITWTEVLEAQRDAFQYKGNDIYHAGNKPTASDVGLGNVTNESKATMFSGAALTNNPTAPTQSAGNNTTRIATTAFVSTAISNLVGTAPNTLDTLQELGDALGDDPNFATTTATALGNRVRVDTNAQNLSNDQKSNARTNIGAGTSNFDGAYGSLSGVPSTFAPSAHNHDDRYYTESESDAKYLLNTTDTLSGALTVTGDLTVQGVNYGLYHAENAASSESGSSSNYYHDPYGGGRHLSMFLKNARADIIRYRAIDNFEYWNGSAWVADNNQLSNVKKLLDGRQDTSWYFGSTYYKFRFTIAPSTSWPTTAKVGTQTSWTGSTYPGHKMIVEEYDGTSWSTRVTAKFGGSNTTIETTDNNCDNWGWNFISTNQLHTGNGNNTGYQSGQNTRITIDFYGWSPSNSSYVTVPMQNIFITSNFSGTENTDYTNLLDYDRNITTAGAINLGHASDTTIARSAAGKVTIEGNEIYHEGHKPTYSEISGTVPTWNQDTTGNAATATSAASANTANTASAVPFSGITSKPTFVVNSALSNRSTAAPDTAGDNRGVTFNYMNGSASPAPTGTDHSLMTMAYSNAWQTQLAQDWREEGRMYVRGQENGTWSSWNQVWDSSDFSKANVLNSNVTLSSLGAAAASHNHDHDALTNYVANEHIDWTAENAGTIHASNFNDNNTFRTIKVDTNNDGTANATLGGSEELKLIGGTAITLSENAGVVTINGVAETYTAHENISAANSVDNSGNTFIQDITLDSNGHITFITSAGVSIPEHDNLTGYVANEHIDWTADASTDIHANNIPDLSGTYLTSLSGAVLTSGAQTVAGTKTFSSAIIANGGVAIQDISDTTITRHSAGHIETPLYRIFDDGYHPNADKWTTARTITLGGDLSGSVSIDGSANVTLTATVANDSHSHSNYITSNANDTVSANTTWNDGNQARFGTGGDLKIQHNGSNAYIDNNTGNLHIRTNVAADVGGNIYIRPHDNEHGIIVTHDSDVKLYHNNSQKFATTSGGISVTGTITATNTIGNKGTNIGQQMEYGTSSVATLRFDSDRWRIYSGGSGGAGERFSVLETGNVGINDSTPSYKLDVNGTIRATGDVIAYSDERVKENIKTIDNSLEKVNKLRGVEFNKIGEDKKSIGVIAQEIEKVLPEVVRTDDEGMKSVAYGNVVGVLIEAVKELTKEVEELKKCNKCKNCNCNA